jgi:hypothetical protein
VLSSSSSRSNFAVRVKVPYLRGHFLSFRAIFHSFGRFRQFSGTDFPILMIFPTSTHGILAPRKRPCTIAHAETVFKRANWAPQLTVFIFVDLGIKALVSLGLKDLAVLPRRLTPLVGPTPSTHHSSARGGGLDTLFPLFFPLFWVP